MNFSKAKFYSKYFGLLRVKIECIRNYFDDVASKKYCNQSEMKPQYVAHRILFILLRKFIINLVYANFSSVPAFEQNLRSSHDLRDIQRFQIISLINLEILRCGHF